MLSSKQLYHLAHLFMNIITVYLTFFKSLTDLIIFVISTLTISLCLTNIERTHHIWAILVLFYTMSIQGYISEMMVGIMKGMICLLTGFPGILLYLSLLFNFYSKIIYFIYAFVLRCIPAIILTGYHVTNSSFHELLLCSPLTLYSLTNSIYYCIPLLSGLQRRSIN